MTAPYMTIFSHAGAVGRDRSLRLTSTAPVTSTAPNSNAFALADDSQAARRISSPGHKGGSDTWVCQQEARLQRAASHPSGGLWSQALPSFLTWSAPAQSLEHSCTKICTCHSYRSPPLLDCKRVSSTTSHHDCCIDRYGRRATFAWQRRLLTPGMQAKCACSPCQQVCFILEFKRRQIPGTVVEVLGIQL